MTYRQFALALVAGMVAGGLTIWATLDWSYGPAVATTLAAIFVAELTAVTVLSAIELHRALKPTPVPFEPHHVVLVEDLSDPEATWREVRSWR
jgi:hypothetical protein